MLPHLLVVLSAVSSLGFDVTVADTFKDAKAALSSTPHPSLLITGVRLGEYNGLHLVLRGTSMSPRLAAIVTSDTDDPVLRTEAERLGATFIAMPVSREELAAAIARTAFRCPDEKRPAEPVRPPFERRHGDRRIVASPVPPGSERRGADRRRDTAVALRQLAETAR
jgi:DNA-binding NtrC family response regulator